MTVHRELGNGFLKSVYHDALELEFTRLGIPFTRDFPIPLSYKGQTLRTAYRADFVCHSSVIVELRTIKTLTDIESAQVLHLLKATGYERAMLINFGTPRLSYKRIIHADNHQRPSADGNPSQPSETPGGL